MADPLPWYVGQRVRLADPTQSRPSRHEGYVTGYGTVQGVVDARDRALPSVSVAVQWDGSDAWWELAVDIVAAAAAAAEPGVARG